MHVGFSYVGAILLVMLFVPNLLWTRNKPKNYDQYAAKEKAVLRGLERIGEVAVSILCLIFSDFNIGKWRVWSLWLLAAAVLMLLYELYWVRYFRSGKTMQDFYRPFLGIPVAGATLPVMAFLLLAVYGKNILLGAAVVLLGIGHIGIHWNHRKETGALPAALSEAASPTADQTIPNKERSL